MKRVITIKTKLNNVKYVFKEEHRGFGIYQEKTPSGYFVSQSWLISDNENNELVIESYNNQCRDELLDMIDDFISTGKYGVKAVDFCNILHMHPNGNLSV